MAPDSIHAESTVEINDSCNNCCCFKWRRDPKPSVKKAARQAKKIPTQQAPRKVERNVTRLHLDATMKDDVEFIMDYKVSPGKE